MVKKINIRLINLSVLMIPFIIIYYSQMLSHSTLEHSLIMVQIWFSFCIVGAGLFSLVPILNYSSTELTYHIINKSLGEVKEHMFFFCIITIFLVIIALPLGGMIPNLLSILNQVIPTIASFVLIVIFLNFFISFISDIHYYVDKIDKTNSTKYELYFDIFVLSLSIFSLMIFFSFIQVYCLLIITTTVTVVLGMILIIFSKRLIEYISLKINHKFGK